MEIFHTSIESIHTTIIKAIFMSVLVILPFSYFFKNKVDSYYAGQFIRYMILSYCSINALSFIISIVLNQEILLAFSGRYAWSAWILLLFHLILPFLLFIKKIGLNLYCLLLISILMNIGWLFESYVIHVTSIHREYAHYSSSTNSYLPFKHEIILLIKGMSFGILALLIGNTIKYFQSVKHKTS